MRVLSTNTRSTKDREFIRHVRAFARAAGRQHLPWRQFPVDGSGADPYAILVSEMMLQQTQVHRVIPYFERWMMQFPTVTDLARAELSDVLTLWSGLGYNRRAKFLHDAAKAVLAREHGVMPREYERLRALPGVGDYTAKAVRVFAFNEPEVLIETNVRAVFLHHFYRGRKNVSDRLLLRHVARTLDMKSPRLWYAALMDYGTHLKATVPNPSRRSAHHVKQARFEGSLRQVRGAIVRAVSRKESLAAVRKLYPDRFDVAYRALVKEGLIQK